MSERGKIRVTCTDRGTHPRRQLAYLAWWPHDPELRETVRALEGIGAETALDAEELAELVRSNRRGRRVDDPLTYEVSADADVPRWRWRCPTCHRDVQLRYDTANRIAEGVLASGASSVDISYLPANLA